MNFPTNLRYTKDHEWISLEGEIATIGITDYAQGELGDIVYVDIDTVGQTVAKDAIFGTVEAVKTVSDLFLPVTGEVLEINEILDANPEKVNTDAYGEGWMVKIKVQDVTELDLLLTADQYKEVIGA